MTVEIPAWVQNPLIWILGLSFAAAVFGAGKWVGAISSDRASFKELSKEVRADIKEILRRIGPAAISNARPIQLTELGQNISKAIDASKWASSQPTQIEKNATGISDYDVQVSAFNYVEACDFDEEMESKIKDCAFSRGLNIKQVLDVLAIELRDHLLCSLRFDPVSEPNGI